MKKFRVTVTQEVVVELDETKFDETFMREFRESHYPFSTLERHAEHIAQLAARSIIGTDKDRFIEGYGPASEMGITWEIVDGDQEATEEKS